MNKASGGSKAAIGILGVLIVLAAAAFVFLTAAPGMASSTAQDQTEAETSGEGILDYGDQKAVTVLGLDGSNYSVDGTTPAVETQATAAYQLPTAAQTPSAQLPAMQQTTAAVPGIIGGFDQDYILPYSNSRYYTYQELSGLSDEMLAYARNEIYARLGRKFNSDDLDRYFRSKSWYNPIYEPAAFDRMGDSAFNEYELANRNLIVEIEGSR